MCLAAGSTLLESGTTGYLGQVVPIRKGETECYECSAKPTQKVYPICTIRSTPDKPVHCIVWAKELYKLLFGNAVESMLFSDPNIAESSESQSAHFDLKPASFDRGAIVDHLTTALKALFITDIKLKLSLNVYKTSKVQPVPLSSALLDEVASRVRSGAVAFGPHSSAPGWEQTVWEAKEALEELFSTSITAYTRISGHTGGLELTFDKDDKLSMRFVTAAANLRAGVFGIPLSSYYDAKGIAGNIIPAISSTNAIIAGLQVS
jgi:ubiquitin-like 1-activating enzyme E1 B